jgi:lysophospholipase L1-like esterase
MKPRVTAAALAALALLALTAAPSFAKSTPPHYYLSLGDSLSVGWQPTSTGAGHETNQGYANDIYAAYKKTIKNLKLVELGCPGATTTSMINGQKTTVKCVQTGGSQLKAALKWLKAHHNKGEVPLITIDIGANDVDGCASDVATLSTCLQTGIGTIKTNTPKILNALRKAAPAGTTFAGMNLYDPFLSYYLQPYSSLYGLSEPSVALAQEVDTAIDAADAAAKFKTADVFDAFRTADKTVIAYNGAQVPTNVADICTLTWMCAAPPVGPNIHANKIGYATIAGAFELVLGKL